MTAADTADLVLRVVVGLTIVAQGPACTIGMQLVTRDVMIRDVPSCKRAVFSQDKPWRSCCPPVATFSWAFMVFCWLGGFLSLSIRHPAYHSLRSTCTVRCAFSVMLRP